MCADNGSAVQKMMRVDRRTSLRLETTDAYKKRLVVYHSNEALRQKRHILHRCAQNFWRKQRLASGAKKPTTTYLIGVKVTVWTNRTFREVGGSFTAPVSVQVASEATSHLGCLALKKRQLRKEKWFSVAVVKPPCYCRQ